VAISLSWSAPAREAARELGIDRAAWNRALRTGVKAALRRVEPVRAAREWAQAHQGQIWVVSASFVDDAEITQLNASYRAKPRSTDVLSFSLAEAAPDEPTEEEQGFPWHFFSPPAGSAPDESDECEPDAELGDLVIAVETAHRQAAERAHSGEVEVLFLSIHGALHLVGYDHGTSAQRRQMWAAQDAVFDAARPGVEAAVSKRVASEEP
jgi:probable rRNA maturation factor